MYDKWIKVDCPISWWANESIKILLSFHESSVASEKANGVGLCLDQENPLPTVFDVEKLRTDWTPCDNSPS